MSRRYEKYTTSCLGNFVDKENAKHVLYAAILTIEGSKVCPAMSIFVREISETAVISKQGADAFNRRLLDCINPSKYFSEEDCRLGGLTPMYTDAAFENLTNTFGAQKAAEMIQSASDRDVGLKQMAGGLTPMYTDTAFENLTNTFGAQKAAEMIQSASDRDVGLKQMFAGTIGGPAPMYTDAAFENLTNTFGAQKAAEMIQSASNRGVGLKQMSAGLTPMYTDAAFENLTNTFGAQKAAEMIESASSRGVGLKQVFGGLSRTNLNNGKVSYRTTIDVICGKCGATIPAGASCSKIGGRSSKLKTFCPYPCRQVYTRISAGQYRTILPRS